MSLSFSPEGPFPLIPITSSDHKFDDYDNLAQWFSTELALTHNVIIRALNSIWLNAPLVPPEDVGSFTGYGLACVAMIRGHHDIQEQVVFPRLQEKVDMRTNVVQHLSFEASLQNFDIYLRRVHDRVEPYECDKVLQLREDLGRDLIPHLHSEIQTVAPKRIYAFTKQELKDLGHAMEDHKQTVRDSATLFPFTVTNHRKEDAPDWPTVSSSMKWLGSHVGFHLHRHYWKFSPYSNDGEFQTYPPLT